MDIPSNCNDDMMLDETSTSQAVRCAFHVLLQDGTLMYVQHLRNKPAKAGPKGGSKQQAPPHLWLQLLGHRLALPHRQQQVQQQQRVVVVAAVTQCAEATPPWHKQLQPHMWGGSYHSASL